MISELETVHNARWTLLEIAGVFALYIGPIASDFLEIAFFVLEELALDLFVEENVELVLGDSPHIGVAIKFLA